MKNWIRHQFRKKSRVYILPTRMGGYLNGLIFLMFLLSIGYSNNLLLIFTLILFAFNLMWLVQSHFHLHRLKLDQVVITPGHAGDPLTVSVLWQKSPAGPLNWNMLLEGDNGDFPLVHHHDEATKSDAEMIPDKRGVYRWKFLKVKSTNPFGLYQVWIYFPIELTTLVYPALLPAVDLNLSGKDQEGELLQDKKGTEDFRGLTSYQWDESRKISWKHYARSGDLLVKEGEEKLAPIFELELKLPTSPELLEHYLSYVATQLVECHRRDIPFHFKAPGTDSHELQECLKVLARC